MIGTELGRADHQHTIHVRVVKTGLDRRPEPHRTGIANDVDRVAARPVGGQHIVEKLHGMVRERGQFHADGAGRVSRQDAGADAVSDDGQPVALRAVIGSQHAGGRKELRDGVDPQHTGTLEGGVVHVLAGGQVTGGRNSAQRFGGPAGLDHHHRLGPGRHAQRAHEAAGIMNVVQVQQDALGLVVVNEVIEDLAKIEVDAVTHRNDAGKADALGVGPVEHGSAQC